jgi:hypothetical protein
MSFSAIHPFPFAQHLRVAALLLVAAVPAEAGHPDNRQQAPIVEPTADLRPLRPASTPAQADGPCDAAIRTAEYRYRLPAGLLFAISQVESGRPDPVMHRLEPWPWTVEAEGKGVFFENKAQAVQWVKEAWGRGVTSIDTGCMQVNLFYHPDAFATLEDAFDPDRNADYAARFLLQLHASTGDWQQATGFYHSQTLALAVSYRERIDRALNGGTLAWSAAPKPPTILDRMSSAWRQTLSANDTASVNPVSTGPVMNDWSVLLHPSTHLRSRVSPPSRAQRPRSYADRSFSLTNLGRP